MSRSASEERRSRAPREEIGKPVLASSTPPLDARLARQVLEAAPTVIYVHDVQRGQSLFQNRRFGELLGHPPDADPAHPGDWTAHIHDEDAKLLAAHRERLKTIKRGETLLMEYRMRDAAGEWRWFLSRDSLLSSDHHGLPELVVGSAFDITEQKQAEQLKELLADEMRHRARNLVSLVQAIGRMSRPKNQPEVNRHIDTFMGRLLTILNTGGIVLSSTARTAELRAVIEATLAPFASANVTSRVSMDGPAVLLTEHTAGGLALAFHELATNAIKYGALSVEQGSIAVRWTLDAGRFTMEWKESGGPPVQPPAQEGFGGMVIRQSIARERGAKITIDYLPDGVCCRFEFEAVRH
jgi:PAS domain S-box-containing protein